MFCSIGIWWNRIPGCPEQIYIEQLLTVVLGRSLLWGGFAAWRGLYGKALFLSAVTSCRHMISPMVVGVGHAGAVVSGYDFALLIVAPLPTRSGRDHFRA
jgi:hypothetical protein